MFYRDMYYVIRAYIAEIKVLGIRDWLWWAVYLRRNEFSHRLNLSYIFDPTDSRNNKCTHTEYMAKYKEAMHKLLKRRMRAHSIDLALSDMVLK